MSTTLPFGTRRLLSLATLTGVLLIAACDFDIVNNNAPTDDELTNNPSRLVLSRTATGIFSLNFNDVGGDIQFYTIYGREGYNLLGNDPRETGEMISGPQDPGGRAGGLWLAKYQAIRTINAYIRALNSTGNLSPAEIAASLGFARTLKAFMFLRLTVRSGALGLPIDVDRPIDAEPAPFVSQQRAFEYTVALLDSAKTNLQAGGSTFPFPIAPGFASFNTPTLFLQFNRAIMARAQVFRATFVSCGAPCWQDALTALGESFVTTAGLPGSLSLGVYWGYSTAASEPTNPITENASAVRYFVHPSLAALVQNQAGGAPDARWSNKTLAVAPHVWNALTGTLKPVMFNSAPDRAVADLGADIPMVKNEELLLLRAEANLGVGNKAAAITDIDLVRVNSGGLATTTLTAASTDDEFITEILYNRVMSLLWEQGVRWIDARRYGRLASLPIDRVGDQVFPSLLVPASECDARALSVPCAPPITP
ncbi:MAG TPA: RagB/SusD family nutrient uptake outer membrane protein [Gemmatimonadales bacterium]